MIWTKRRNINKVKARGNIYYYHRKSGARLPDDPNSTDFARAWEREEAKAGPAVGNIKPGTLQALITEYKGSSAFRTKSDKTRRDYSRYLDLLGLAFGDLKVKDINREFVIELKEQLSRTPRKADYAIQVLRLLFTFAMDRPSKYDGVQVNPAAKPGRLAKPEGHRPVEESEIAAFRKCWDAGTLERVTFELFLNTGQRGGDVCGMMRQHYFRGRISVRQDKTAERVLIPASKDLRAVLDPWIEGHKHISLLVTTSGGSLKPRYMRSVMRDAFTAAGLPADCTLHGLRYTFGVVAREIGLEGELIASILGHRTADMIRKYTEKRRNAEIVIARLDDARGRNDE